MTSPKPRRLTGWQRLAYGVLLGVLSFTAALSVSEADLAARAGILRYWSLLSAAVFATAVPYLLWPDPQTSLHQLLNRRPVALLAHHGRLWGPVVALFVSPILVGAVYDPGGFAQDLPDKGAMLLRALLVVAGTGCYSLNCYAVLGPTAQAWQEGRAGRRYQAMKEETGKGFDVPPGLVPALMTTARVFGVALAVVLVSAYLSASAGAASSWIPGALLLGGASMKLTRQRATYDRYFYHTNAFYSEVLGSGTQTKGRTAIPVSSLYWVPRRWRPAVWASLRQFDRLLPLGRIVLVAHLVLWILFIQGATPAVITGYLALLVIGQNAACTVLVQRALAPPLFQIALQSPVDWLVTRFFVNLRWTLPFAGSLALVALFDPGIGLGDVLVWTGLDVGAAFTVAALVTYATEGTARRQFA